MIKLDLNTIYYNDEVVIEHAKGFEVQNVIKDIEKPRDSKTFSKEYIVTIQKEDGTKQTFVCDKYNFDSYSNLTADLRLYKEETFKIPEKKSYRSTLHPKHIDDIVIEGLYKGSFLMDIIVHLPEGYKHRDISFMDVGLLNTSGDISYECENGGLPIVTLKLYGKFKASNYEIPKELSLVAVDG